MIPQKKRYWKFQHQPQQSPVLSNRLKRLTSRPVPASDTITVSTFTPSLRANQIQVNITDLLGEPVSNGTIRIGNSDHPFHNGYLIVDTTPETPTQWVASAEGYQSATETIAPEHQQSVLYALDYTSRYRIIVTKGMTIQTPVEGADVYLYQANPAQRPPAKAISVRLQPEGGLSKRYTLRMDESDLKITESNDESLINHTIRNPRSTDRVLRIEPSIGDFAVSVGSLLWNPYKNTKWASRPFFSPLDAAVSPKVRILDVLELTKGTLAKDGVYDYIQLLHNQDLNQTCLSFPPYTGREAFIGQFKTGTDGTIITDALKPGLYYATAVFGSQRSMVYPIPPSCGGVTLALASSCCLDIYTGMAGVPTSYFLQKTMLEGVKVILKLADMDTSPVFMGTTDYSGKLQLKTVPFGRYTITATAPPEKNLPEIHTEIQIYQPSQRVNLEFEGLTTHTIEGTAVEYDTKKPVRDIPVELLEYWKSGYDPCAKTVSDHEGKFSFPNLPPGRYKVAFMPDFMENTEYYPYSEKAVTTRPEDEQPFIGRSRDEYDQDYETDVITVLDQPVYTVTMMVLKIEKTHFSGHVEYEDSRPAPHAEIGMVFDDSVKAYKSNVLATSPSPPFTDQKGDFSFSLFSKKIAIQKVYNYPAIIRATVDDIVPPFWLEKILPKGSSFEYHNEDKITRAFGKKNIQFKLGDTINNINIVISDQNLFNLKGRIITDDGQIPSSVEFFVWQNRWWVYGNYSPNGEFSLDGLERDSFINIFFNNASRLDEDGVRIFYEDTYGTLLKEQVEELLAKSPDYKTLQYEVLLKRSGYIKGRVLDSNQNPVNHICVMTSPVIGPGQFAFTDKGGYFNLQKLSAKEKYTLYLAIKEDEPAVPYLSDVQPNVDTIILVLKP